MSLHPHQTAQAQHQHSSHSTVYIPLLACCWQCQRKPHLIAANFPAERSSPRTAGNLNISNCNILNTFKLHPRRLWLFTARPDALSLLSVENSMLTKIQSKTRTCVPTSQSIDIIAHFGSQSPSAPLPQTDTNPHAGAVLSDFIAEL